MGQKQRSIRYAYIKNGDVITQLQRILPITRTIPTSGPDAFIADFLRFVGGQPVLLVSSHDRNARFQDGNIEGRVFVCNASFPGLFMKIKTRILAFLKTLFLLLKFRPNRILCGCHGPMLWVSFLVSRLYSIPFVYSSHNSLLPSESLPYKRLFAAIDKCCVLDATAVICHGPYMAAQLFQMGVSSDRIFEFDIGFQDMFKELHIEEEIAQLKHSNVIKYVLYLGRIETDKGIFDLLEACIQRVRNDPHVKLVYLGNGSQLEQLQKRVRDLMLADEVIFLGEVSHEAVPRVIRKARIVVTPTRSVFPEARCMAAMEGLFSGVPVVAPDSGPFPYLITHGVNGLLFQANSVGHLKHSILSLLDDDSLYKQLRKGAQQTAKDLLYPPMTFSQAVELAFCPSVRTF